MQKIITFLAVLALVGTALAIRQEAIFYDGHTSAEQGNIFTFQTHVADNSHVSSGAAEMLCVKGAWNFYQETNFQGPAYHLSHTHQCYTSNVYKLFKSFRYIGAFRTEDVGLSLYSEAKQSGLEIFINQTAYALIETPIKSIGLTGSTSYTLFEGINFNGTSHCLEPQSSARAGVTVVDLPEGLSTVGSVLKSCESSLSYEELDVIRQQYGTKA